MIGSILRVIGSILRMIGSILRMIGSILRMIGSILRVIGSILRVIGSILLAARGMPLAAKGNTLYDWRSPRKTGYVFPGGFPKTSVCGKCSLFIKKGADNMSKDWIPRKDSAFDGFFKGIIRYVAQKCGGQSPEWTHIPLAVRTEMDGVLADWDAAYNRTLGPHSSVETQAKNDARKAAQAALRPFRAQYLSFPPVTDADRAAMGLSTRNTRPTPIPVPTSQAEADLVFPGVHLVELTAIRKTGTISSDSRSDRGVRIHLGILDSPGARGAFRIFSLPVTGDDLPHSVFTRRKKYRFDFDGLSGKTVYFCLCYENGKGQRGPYGPILHAIIP
ncbi:MAG: hypothetical protein LBI86_06485 [Treponema sp.]|jgi:hypothetical protein|nr:hypothetical protein [Treponema sp.]